MLEVKFGAEDLDEVEEFARQVLEERRDDIVDGKLNGHHWFVALCSEAEALIRRHRVAHLRSSDV